MAHIIMYEYTLMYVYLRGFKHLYKVKNIIHSIPAQNGVNWQVILQV